MRFSQLPVGARFAFEGATCVKTNPLVAVPESGGKQRLIGRYAEVQPLGAASASSAPPAPPLDPQAVRAAFEEFYRRCLDFVPDNDTAARVALDEARRCFLDMLGR